MFIVLCSSNLSVLVSFYWDLVVSAFTPWVTTQNSSQSQIYAFYYTIPIDRFIHILTACGSKAARSIG